MSADSVTTSSYHSTRSPAARAWRGFTAFGGLALVLLVTWHSDRVTSRTRTRVDETAQLLSELRHAVAARGGFTSTVGANPMALSQLTRPLWNARSDPVPPPSNSCGLPFTDAQVRNWDKGGPFVPFYLPTTGLRVPIGVIADTLRRARQTATSAMLQARILYVADRDATLLDESIDGGDGASAGSVMWVPAEGLQTVLYSIGVVTAC